MNDKKSIKINTKCFGLSDQIFFAQRLSLLLSSGISIVDSLKMIMNIENSKYRKAVYMNITRDIEHGISLGKSINDMKLRFSNTLIVLIRNGEESGRLSESLYQAYQYLEKGDEIKKKIIGSLIYPCFIVVATILMTLFLIIYIFPKIIPLLSSLNIKLPLITRVVQWIYYLLISYGIWMFIGLIIVLISSKIIVKKSQKIRYKVHKCIISIPFISKYIKIHMMSSVCNMSEILLSSGKSLTDVLIFSSDSSRNLVYKDIFNEIYIQSVRGVSLSNSLKRYAKYFPSLLIDMCELGERTGNMALMFKHCSRIFEQDIDNTIKKFSSLIEPVLMIFMGLIVGSVALSIILPVYEITNSLSK